MSERTRNLATLGVAAVALLVVVVGLAGSGDAAPVDPAARAHALEIRLKCPFCVGESLADSRSGVAADLRALIERRIAEGASDEEIIDEFVANYGESILLDPGLSRRTALLWAAPALLALVGVAVMFRLRRRDEP